MMNKNRILYLVLLFLSLLFIYFYGGDVPYTIFYVVLALPFASLLYTLIIYFRLKYYQELGNRTVIKGDDVKFSVSVSNEDVLLYPYVKLSFRGSETLFLKQLETMHFSLLPFETKTFSVDLRCKYRGNYSIGIDSIEIEDWLGIFKFKIRGVEFKNITVYPRIINLNKFHIKTNLFSESSSVLNGSFKDMMSMSDARKYAYGDPFKSIHWKLTAKLNEIMVKNMESTLMTSATIFLDVKKTLTLSDKNIIIEDKVIETLVAVVNYCLSNWVRINLIYFDNEIVNLEGKNPLDFKRIFDVLSLVKFNTRANLKDILKVYLNYNITRTNIIIFTSNLDYELFDEISKIKNSNYEVTMIYISPEEVTLEKNPEADEIVSFLPEIGIDTYKINISDDIRQVLER